MASDTPSINRGFPYRKCLMIGGTSGIGSAMTRTLIEHGVYVIVVGRRFENLDNVVRSYDVSRRTLLAFDITKLATIPKWARMLLIAHPDIDAVWFNAGTRHAFDFSLPENRETAKLENELVTNYLAHVHIAAAFLAYLRLRSRETPVAFVATTYQRSSLGQVHPHYTNYATSKVALCHWLRALRDQFRIANYTNFRVIEVSPPVLDTELRKSGLEEPPFEMSLYEFSEKCWQGLVRGQAHVSPRPLFEFIQSPILQGRHHEADQRSTLGKAQGEPKAGDREAQTSDRAAGTPRTGAAIFETNEEAFDCEELSVAQTSAFNVNAEAEAEAFNGHMETFDGQTEGLDMDAKLDQGVSHPVPVFNAGAMRSVEPTAGMQDSESCCNASLFSANPIALNIHGSSEASLKRKFED